MNVSNCCSLEFKMGSFYVPFNQLFLGSVRASDWSAGVCRLPHTSIGQSPVCFLDLFSVGLPILSVAIKRHREVCRLRIPEWRSLTTRHADRIIFLCWKAVESMVKATQGGRSS